MPAIGLNISYLYDPPECIYRDDGRVYRVLESRSRRSRRVRESKSRRSQKVGATVVQCCRPFSFYESIHPARCSCYDCCAGGGGGDRQRSDGFAVRNVAQIAAHAIARVQHGGGVSSAAGGMPAHTFSEESATNLTLDARPGGCLCERWPNGGATHLMVVYVVAQQEIRFSGALGPLQQRASPGSKIWKLTESAAALRSSGPTRLADTCPGGLAAIAPAVDAVLAGQLQRLKQFRRDRPSGVDFARCVSQQSSPTSRR